MHRTQFVYRNIEAADKLIMSQGPDVAYFNLRDFHLGGRSAHLARLDFEPEQVRPFLERRRSYPESSTASRRKVAGNKSARSASWSLREASDDSAGLDELDPDDMILEEDDDPFFQRSDHRSDDDDEQLGDTDDDEDEDDFADDPDDDNPPDHPQSSSAYPIDRTRVERARTSSRMIAEDEELNHETMLKAVCNWMRDVAEAHVADREAASIRIQAFAPKGSKVLNTVTFHVRNLEYDPEIVAMAERSARDAEAREKRFTGEVDQDDGPTGQRSHANGGYPAGYPNGRILHHQAANGAPTAIESSIGAPPSQHALQVSPPLNPACSPQPWQPHGHAFAHQPAEPMLYSQSPGMMFYPTNFQDGTLYQTNEAYQNLSQNYKDFGQLLLEGAARIQKMMSSSLSGMGEDLQSAREQVNLLVEQILTKRVEELEAQNQHEGETQEVAERSLLAREAINQIGDAAKAFFISRGMSAESAELMQTLGSHPRLMAVLQEPSVQALLKQPETLDLLAGGLLQLGQQAGGSEAEGTGASGQTGTAKAAGDAATPSSAIGPGAPPAALPPGGPWAPPAGQPSPQPGAWWTEQPGTWGMQPPGSWGPQQPGYWGQGQPTGVQPPQYSGGWKHPQPMVNPHAPAHPEMQGNGWNPPGSAGGLGAAGLPSAGQTFTGPPLAGQAVGGPTASGPPGAPPTSAFGTIRAQVRLSPGLAARATQRPVYNSHAPKDPAAFAGHPPGAMPGAQIPDGAGAQAYPGQRGPGSMSPGNPPGGVPSIQATGPRPPASSGSTGAPGHNVGPPPNPAVARAGQQAPPISKPPPPTSTPRAPRADSKQPRGAGADSDGTED